MTLNGLTQVLFYFVVLLGLAKPLGWYMAQVYEGRSCGLDRIFSPIERLIYRMCKIDPAQDMTWK
ncbi:MAG TPA: potassium-transporting ATPase subunit KdpA, partial [Nitrospira sp.]|nr:potassium-transporting ATPase subunit KdpA [Nitrospira sp.]